RNEITTIIPGTCTVTPFGTFCTPDRVVTTYEYEYPTEEMTVDISDGALLPSAKIAFKPWDGVQLFGSYSRAFRPPTIMEAFITGSHVGALGPGYAPNPSLTA